MGSMVRWIATTTLLGLLLMAGAAAQTPTVINWVCDGSAKQSRQEEVTEYSIASVGVVVNLTEQTVATFGIVMQIDHADAGEISFSGEGPRPTTGTVSVTGRVDRTTGVLLMTRVLSDTDKRVEWMHSYDLRCKITN
jgi:hypothetical protein